jgi:hypothetical protein
LVAAGCEGFSPAEGGPKRSGARSSAIIDEGRDRDDSPKRVFRGTMAVNREEEKENELGRNNDEE